jgi:hypothetical protein
MLTKKDLRILRKAIVYYEAEVDGGNVDCAPSTLKEINATWQRLQNLIDKRDAK